MKSGRTMTRQLETPLNVHGNLKKRFVAVKMSALVYVDKTYVRDVYVF